MAAAQSLTTNPQATHKPNLHGPKFQSLKPYTLQNPSFLGTFQSISISHPRGSFLQPISAVAALPTAKPERLASGEKVPQWSWRAIKAFSQAELEARKLKYLNTGTECLLLGVLIEGTGVAAKFLWENGVTLFKTRDEIVKLFGKGKAPPNEFPPLTDDAQRAIDWALDHRMKSGNGGETTTIDMILGIWSEVDSPGHKVLAAMGINEEKVKELKSKNSGPEILEA